MNARLFIICGNAGTGKTTYARGLASSLGATLLDIDTVSEALVRVGLEGYGIDPDDRDSPRYKQLYRDAIHETLFQIAAENLDNTKVVIVAPFTQERRRADWLEIVQQRLGVKPHVVYMHCSEEIRRERIKQRANPRDAGKLERWTAYAAEGADAARPPFEHQWLDTSNAENQ